MVRLSVFHFCTSPIVIVDKYLARVKLGVCRVNSFWNQTEDCIETGPGLTWTTLAAIARGMKWVVRALSVPSADTDACLTVFFESAPSNKYLFNCSEGTFRAIQQRKVGLSRIKALFLTRIHTQRSSGVPSKSHLLHIFAFLMLWPQA